MSFRNWWRQKSGKSKTITILATLAILQVGLCFGTPALVSGFESVFGPSRDQELGLGLMIWQALGCFVTIVALLMAAAWTPESVSEKEEMDEDSNDR